MIIVNVKQLQDNEILVDYYGFASDLQQKLFKLIDGKIHKLTDGGYIWKPIEKSISDKLLARI